MTVIAFDPYVPAEAFARAGVASVDFAELLKVSDFVSIHCPLSPETRGLFGADAFHRGVQLVEQLFGDAGGDLRAITERQAVLVRH